MKSLFLKETTREKKIQLTLYALRPYFPTNADELFCWFRGEVLKLLSINNLRLDDLERIISWVSTEITTRDRVELKDQSTHNRIESQINIIRIGLQDLEDFSRKHRLNTGARNRAAEDSAIQLDAKALRRYVNRIWEYRNDKIMVYDMANPTAQPFIVAARSLQYPTCDNIRTQLINQRRQISPDLWARHCGLHQLTRDRYSWTYVMPDEDITAMDLEFLDRAAANSENYIVALTLRENRDVAQPIELPPRKAPCCGQYPPCPTLEAHLQSLWSGISISRALRIQDEADALASQVHEFEPRSNNLLIV